MRPFSVIYTFTFNAYFQCKDILNTDFKCQNLVLLLFLQRSCNTGLSKYVVCTHTRAKEHLRYLTFNADAVIE